MSVLCISVYLSVIKKNYNHALGHCCISQMEVKLTETCDVFPLPYFMFPSQLQFTQAVGLCRAVGGELAVARNLEEQQVDYTDLIWVFIFSVIFLHFLSSL